MRRVENVCFINTHNVNVGHSIAQPLVVPQTAPKKRGILA